jgi:hypothetical protein
MVENTPLATLPSVADLQSRLGHLVREERLTRKLLRLVIEAERHQGLRPDPFVAVRLHSSNDPQSAA